MGEKKNPNGFIHVFKWELVFVVAVVVFGRNGNLLSGSVEPHRARFQNLPLGGATAAQGDFLIGKGHRRSWELFLLGCCCCCCHPVSLAQPASDARPDVCLISLVGAHLDGAGLLPSIIHSFIDQGTGPTRNKHKFTASARPRARPQ